MIRRSRKDHNHDALAAVFRQMGCSVVDMHNTGIAGWPDKAVGCLGVTHIVETKNPLTAYGRSGLNDNQTAFSRDWRGSPVHVVSTEQDVIDLVNQWRRGK